MKVGNQKTSLEELRAHETSASQNVCSERPGVFVFFFPSAPQSIWIVVC